MLVVLLRVFGHGDSLVPNSATILSYRQKDGEVTFIESGAIVGIVQWDSFFKPRRDSQPRNRQAETVLYVAWDLVDAECVISMQEHLRKDRPKNVWNTGTATPAAQQQTQEKNLN